MTIVPPVRSRPVVAREFDAGTLDKNCFQPCVKTAMAMT
jgi:hypothetical protein